jgi:APA family basic amino acid/polyamine antiporter
VSNRRTLSLTAASVTVVANMIGTGVFTTTGLMAAMGASSGDILLGWFLGGLIALFGALCYGEVGANLPHSGGEYYYLSRLLHPALGFMSGAVSLVVGFAAPIAASAIALNLYIGTVVPKWPVSIMAAVTVIVLSLLHGLDLHIGSRFQTAITFIKVTLIVVFVGGVLAAAPGVPSDLLAVQPKFLLSSPFAVVLVFVAFAYAGWNAAAYIGTELKEPKRTLPRSLLIGTTLVTLLYILLNLSYLMVVSTKDLSGVEQVGYLVAMKLWGEGIADVVSMLIALTLLCPISAMLMVGPRIAEAMARDGFLPPGLSKLNRRKVPSRAVALQASLAAIIALTSSFGGLLIYIGFTLNIFAALTVISLFVLRRENRAHYVKVCVGYPFTPIIFLIFTLWMTIWSIREQPAATLAGVATLLVGYLLYLLRARQARLVEESVTGS